jgi:hypothetical protein
VLGDQAARGIDVEERRVCGVAVGCAALCLLVGLGGDGGVNYLESLFCWKQPTPNIWSSESLKEIFEMGSFWSWSDNERNSLTDDFPFNVIEGAD